jgi:hypothetical protein
MRSSRPPRRSAKSQVSPLQGSFCFTAPAAANAAAPTPTGPVPAASVSATLASAAPVPTAQPLQPATHLSDYASQIGKKAGTPIASGELFAKILTPNDDSGRHGVLIPAEGYSFFPPLDIADERTNATGFFRAFDVRSEKWVELAYKYYQRYPERRITKLNPIFNDVSRRRLVVFLRASTESGEPFYAVDSAVADTPSADSAAARTDDLSRLEELLFGSALPAEPGFFIRREISAPGFALDPVLREFLDRFDEIKARGWIDTLRAGDTGIGYTFESLLGIKENNDKIADYRGIEIKCKLARERTPAGGKINLFQQGPAWRTSSSAWARLRRLGRPGANGLYACHSQITTTANNIALKLAVQAPERIIELIKDAEVVGNWSYDTLQKRLQEKHARAVFVKARSRSTPAGTQYSYDEVVYCERPKIDEFVRMVEAREIVFEFLMSEKADGSVRNHGYPWRLNHEALIERLFSLQIKLR